MSKNIDIIHNVKFWQPKIQEDVVFFSGHFNSFEFEKHVHEEYTITLVHDSNMKAFLNGFSHQFNKSTILTINPDEIHACKTKEIQGYKYNSIYFKPSLLEKVFGKEAKDMYFSKNTLTNSNLYKKLSYLVHLDQNNDISKLDFECMFIECLRDIMTLNTNYNTNKNTNYNKSKILKSAKEFINDNYQLDLCLDDIANEFKISKYHFLRLFKEHNFVSPHSYLMIKRVERAKEFLKKGESLTSIAQLCGFYDQSHFSRKFKALTGLTPGHYQKFFN